MTPKIREILYVVGVVVFAGLTVLSTFKVIDPSVAASVNAAVTAVLGLFGVTVAGTAAYNVNRQRQEGTFEPTDPADAVVSGIEAVLKAKQEAEQSVDRVRVAVTNAVKDVPILGPLAKEALDRLN
jgi:hypothetical protein